MENSKPAAIFDKSLEEFIKEEKMSQKKQGRKGKTQNFGKRRRIKKHARKDRFRKPARVSHLVVGQFIADQRLLPDCNSLVQHFETKSTSNDFR